LISLVLVGKQAWLTKARGSESYNKTSVVSGEADGMNLDVDSTDGVM